MSNMSTHEYVTADNRHVTEIHFYPYFPPEVQVKRVLDTGAGAWIGETDDTTVYRYPKIPGEHIERLEAERKLLEIVGAHERIIGLKGFTDTGLYLERAANGDVLQYMIVLEQPVSAKQRLTWCREAAEAVAWIHSRCVLDCDINPGNLLLDDHFHIKLADFQRKHLSEEGESLVGGWSSEPARYKYPREDIDDANTKTDMFALGSTIYFIINGHNAYPDIPEKDRNNAEKVEARFTSPQFPQDEHVCSAITRKCWQQDMEYESADEIVRDLEYLERES
ncbi:hypothetical protein CDD83_426 [Cordyceps sp. RAO-2017]|nr:hypothetical protein CDD83_426 [Cordyceps sp. RAO-2017]